MNKILVTFLIFMSGFFSTAHAGDLEYNLYDAINRGEYDYTVELINKGADVNTKQEPFKQTPIIMAPLRGIEFVELLVEHGADVNSKDQDNTTALINACLYGNTEVARYLISKGANIHAVNNDGISVLDAALLSENKRVIRFIKTQHKNK